MIWMIRRTLNMGQRSKLADVATDTTLHQQELNLDPCSIITQMYLSSR